MAKPHADAEAKRLGKRYPLPAGSRAMGVDVGQWALVDACAAWAGAPTVETAARSHLAV
ncbi:hypothetical protein ACH5A3_41785 [Streptomyces echinatus]|uniref:hypothetical protein n=1 Tax=Streptomyces echinatus TaxID=67293 RepID=UPI00378D5384